MREYRIGLNRLQQRRIAAKTLRIAPHNRRQIETKTRDTELRHPVTQGIQTQTLHARLREIQRIATARIIAQALFVQALIPISAVIIALIQAPHGHGRAMLITLGGVVEHHIQNHPNAVFVQHTHSFA